MDSQQVPKNLRAQAIRTPLTEIAGDKLPARLNHPRMGVIGPPGRACGSVMHVDNSGSSPVVKWNDGTLQVVGDSDYVLEYFRPHHIDAASVRAHWADLLSNYSHKALSVPHGTFLLMTGLPGAGKTTLAASMARALGLVHFDFADFARSIIGHHPLCQSDYVDVGALVEPLISQFLLGGGGLIYDTTAVSAKLRQHHLTRVPIRSRRLVIWIPTAAIICRERLQKQRPSESPDLRPHVRRVSPSHVRTFNDFAREFERPSSALIARNEEGHLSVCQRVATCLFK